MQTTVDARSTGTGPRLLRAHLEAGFVYGGHRRVDGSLKPIGDSRYMPIGNAPHLDFLRCNPVGMHATVIYDREKLLAAGGFDTTLRRCEDYDVYMRMSRSMGSRAIQVSSRISDTRRNMSTDSKEMLRWVERIRDMDRKRNLATDESGGPMPRGAGSGGSTTLRRCWRIDLAADDGVGLAV
jgi:hypothetical protein